MMDELETVETEDRMKIHRGRKEAKNVKLEVSEEKQLAKKFCFC